MFFPSSEIEVAAILSEAKEPLSVAGGNTRVLAPSGSKIISTSKLSGVIDYEPGALTMIAKAGTPLSEIQKTLTSEGQCLAFDPYNWSRFINKKGSSTIGGVFAANVSGSSRLRVGAARDFLLGIRLVDGLGNIIQNGGRVMKNVTGYDLVKLFAGSWGTLGILTEVSFKVLPKPETEATIVIHGLNDQLALDAMIDATATPFDVSGLAHFPKQKETMIRVEGFENSVKYRVERLMELLKNTEKLTPLMLIKVWKSGVIFHCFHHSNLTMMIFGGYPLSPPRVLKLYKKQNLMIIFMIGVEV